MSNFEYAVVEYFQIEKYMGGSPIYVVTSWAVHHVMCTFLFKRTAYLSITATSPAPDRISRYHSKTNTLPST
jgi:hypothetical protein